MTTLQVDVVSAEASLFSGEAKFVALPGVSGELGIYPRHTPLITRIRPGSVRIEQANGEQAYIFVAGGILEVQPDGVTVLADTAIRGEDLDEEKARAAKASAEEALRQTMTISRGSFGIFLDRPASVWIIMITVALLVILPVIGRIGARAKADKDMAG